MIKMIFAMDKCHGIGKGGTIPWYIPEDLKKFKELTNSHVVVMGKNTWNDPMFPKPLKGRKTYVLTTNKDTVEKAECVDRMYEIGHFENFLNDLDREYVPDKDVWIIGGASLYNATMKYVEEFHITMVKGDYDCDTFVNFKYIMNNFKVYSSSSHKSKKGVEYDYLVYRR